MERLVTLQGADLSDADVAEVAALVADCATADGTAPVSEHVLLALRHKTNGLTHLLLRDDERLLGYAFVERGDHDTSASSELCVHPAHRGRGFGGRLVSEVVAATPIRIWAHGDHPSAGALAQHYGLSAVRNLFRLRKRLSTVAAPKVPEGVTIRTFMEGDEDKWLAVNARAFSWHPEQGRMTRKDLDERLAEPWFDAEGLFLAERDGEVIGFHWTKVHEGASPIGEVYVLAVDPDAQGIGLGRVLTDVGLRHLARLGLANVMLYVDGENTAALRLYERSGFTRWSTDVQYERA
ncbi:mycothiol synthase [Actinorhabdospora filicis]|uniref:mycothiol synthase n=1 Tax=Actinorhabdospora filicis TaxID=1785913 RepID=UPI00255794E0|nr:mycothiol synthase [Actinorhabdospora filicis]